MAQFWAVLIWWGISKNNFFFLILGNFKADISLVTLHFKNEDLRGRGMSKLMITGKPLESCVSYLNKLNFKSQLFSIGCV